MRRHAKSKEANGSAPALASVVAQSRLGRALLVIQCCAALYAAGSIFPAMWANRWVQDDAYVSFRYARNFVRGEGLVYNPGQRVEGYSNFLWTMLSAVPLTAGVDDPLPFMHAAGAALWGGTYALLLILAVRLWRHGVWAAPLAIVAVSQHWSFNMWFFSGMETPLVSFLVTLMLFCFSYDPEEHPASLFCASLAGVLLTMTRPDGVVAMAAIAVAGMIVYRRRIFVERKWRIYVLAPALPVLLLWLPYNLWRVAYYGSFFPNTYYAKVAYLPYYARGWDYLLKYLSVFHLSAFLPFVFLGALLAPGAAARRYLIATASVIGCLALYVVRLGGDFMEWRFVTPVTGILYVAIVAGASSIVAALAGRQRRPPGDRREPAIASSGAQTASWIGGALVALGLTAATSVAMPDWGSSIVGGQEAIGSLRRYGDSHGFDWHSTGRLFNDVLPADVTIATTSAGIIPFFADRPCLDLHGLTDPEIARAPVRSEQRGRMGHEHWLDDRQEIRRRGVDILLLWAEPRSYPKALVTPPQDGFETVSVQRPDGRYVDFTILNPDAVDRDALARDPRVVFFGNSPIADKNVFHALASRFADHAVVDSLDLENGDDQNRHAYEEFYPPDRPGAHIYHTKFLRHAPPVQHIAFEDSGRRIILSARWRVHGVDADRDLIVIGRHDHTGESLYEIEINGRATTAQLRVPTAGDEMWGETWARVSREFLVAGTNEMRITRTSPGAADAEWYFFWFLQPPETDAVDDS